MFLEFFFLLREKGIPVTLHEWLLLVKALDMDLHRSSLRRFYMISKTILVKNAGHYPLFDAAFSEFFHGREKSGMERPQKPTGPQNPGNSQDEGPGHTTWHSQLEDTDAAGTNLPIPGAWGGTSPLSGASKIPFKRRYRNYSDDEILDTRKLKVALSRLRKLLPEDEYEVNIPETIRRTCELCGELDLVFTRKLTKKVKILLLLDSGGSMDPHYSLVSRLFSAARSLFRDMKYYTFHNCIYQDLWIDIEKDVRIKTEDVLRLTGKEYKLVVVGDAAMAPGELFEPGGAIDMDYHNPLPGIEWLKRLRKSFPSSIWLNPLPESLWGSIETVRVVSGIFPMFPLTLRGLEDGMKKLIRGSRWEGPEALRL